MQPDREHPTRARLAGFVCVVLGVAIVRAKPIAGVPDSVWICSGCLLTILGILGWIASINDRGRSPSSLRLDHFLPFLRKKWRIQGRPHWMVRKAMRVLPESVFFDPITGRPGAARRMLRWLGPVALAAPLRRGVQVLSLALFLWSFFYICWPYSARPQAPGRVLPDLRFETIDQESGRLGFLLPPLGASGQPTETELWHLAETGNPSAPPVGLFRVTKVDGDRLWLEAQGGLTELQLDQVLLGTGRWELLERPPGDWPSHHADNLARKEIFAAEGFLILDPLVSLSTSIAARRWVWSLAGAVVILIACVLVPRGFCGYLCPLGTLIDLFDGTIGKRWTRFRVAGEGWWVHIKYYLLSGVLIAALFGVLLSGYVAAIPVVTRGFLFVLEPVQSGLLRGWHLIPPLNAGHWVSIGLFAGVLALGLLRPRFWCRYVCPSGALFSLGNLFRITERKVEASCIHCNKCVAICPFDAIKPDFTTRVTDCTLCQTCGGVCPTHSIKFVERWNRFDLKTQDAVAVGGGVFGRRGFIGLAGGSAAALVVGAGGAAITRLFGANLGVRGSQPPVRPPGSVPEPEFLELCIRCGECFKACPNSVLQPMGFGQGLEGLWTPRVNADWAGCDSSCNACGQVCPTGAIRALPLAEKRWAHMGLAFVDQATCLPFAGREACQLCVDECAAAGYNAIEFTRVGTQADAGGLPIDGTGYLAPVVREDLCVGCGLCQTRCRAINVEEKGLLNNSAIIIEAGSGREDRLSSGSYAGLRAPQSAARAMGE